MAQFSVKIIRLTGSVLGENQHHGYFKASALLVLYGVKIRVTLWINVRKRLI